MQIIISLSFALPLRLFETCKKKFKLGYDVGVDHPSKELKI
jgi:hypothetical protein